MGFLNEATVVIPCSLSCPAHFAIVRIDEGLSTWASLRWQMGKWQIKVPAGGHTAPSRGNLEV